MSNGIYDYVKTEYRPRKRAAQQELYSYVAQELGPEDISVVDLPSLDMREYNSIERMNSCGINIYSYFAYETSPSVYSKIKPYAYRGKYLDGARTMVRNKDVIVDLISSKKNKVFYDNPIGLFNLDFCSALTPSYSVFQIAQGVAQNMAKRAALIVTFSLRGGVGIRPSDSLKFAIEQSMPALYKVRATSVMRRTYRDTAPMGSWCYILEK